MELITLGNPVLRTKAKPIQVIDALVLQTISLLSDEVMKRNGLGLASPQIGISLALFVTRFPEDHADKIVPGKIRLFINPKIIKVSEEIWEAEEGCLSIPKIFAQVRRPLSIVVEYQDASLQSFTEEFSQWPARIMMHENDHLNGVLFIDRLQNQTKKLLRSRLATIKSNSKN